MPETDHYRNIVLGSGTAGKFFGWTLAKQGERTAVVERKWIGGSCPNVACLPSKNIIHSAKVASLFGRAAEFGIETQPFAINMKGVRNRKRAMVDGFVKTHLANYEQSGAELILGEGRLAGAKTLEVKLNDGGTRRLTADRLFLNLGTHATIPDTPGLAAARPMTHIEALELDHIPDHLVIRLTQQPVLFSAVTVRSDSSIGSAATTSSLCCPLSWALAGELRPPHLIDGIVGVLQHVNLS